MGNELSNILTIARNIAKVRKEMSMQSSVFACVICGTDTPFIIASKLNYYCNNQGNVEVVEDLEPKFALLRWNSNATAYKPQFLVCGADCRVKYLKSLPYDTVMNNMIEDPVVPMRLLGNRIEDFNSQELVESLKQVGKGWVIAGQDSNTRSRMLAALIYEMRIRDKTVIYLDGNELDFELEKTAKSYRLDDFKSFVNNILKYDVIAIDDIDGMDWQKQSSKIFFKKIDGANKLIASTLAELPDPNPITPATAVFTRLNEICTVIV